MRQLKSFFIILLMLVYPALSKAEKSTDVTASRPPVTLSPGHKGGHGKFPKAPSRQSITCEYNGAEMEFHFTVSEGICTLCVTDQTPQTVTYTIDTSSFLVDAAIAVKILL